MNTLTHHLYHLYLLKPTSQPSSSSSSPSYQRHHHHNHNTEYGMTCEDYESGWTEAHWIDIDTNKFGQVLRTLNLYSLSLSFFVLIDLLFTPNHPCFYPTLHLLLYSMPTSGVTHVDFVFASLPLTLTHPLPPSLTLIHPPAQHFTPSLPLPPNTSLIRCCVR